MFYRCRGNESSDQTDKMISRRKIISRSLDNLDAIGQEEQEEDVWHDREKLFRVRFLSIITHLISSSSIIHTY